MVFSPECYLWNCSSDPKRQILSAKNYFAFLFLKKNKSVGEERGAVAAWEKGRISSLEYEMFHLNSENYIIMILMEIHDII